MSLQEIINKIKGDFQREHTITKNTLQQLKKILEQLKTTQQKTQDILVFKQKIIGLCYIALQNYKPSQADKIAILQLLQRELISSKHNSNLFNKLYNYLTTDDQNVATQASKTIDALIKQINQKSQVTTGATTLDLKQHYTKLFEFLKDRTEFLLKLKQHVKDPDFRTFKRQPFDQSKDNRQREKKDVVFKNTKSLKFINQVPHLFIHLMAYAELDTKVPEQQKKIKDLIKESIENIIQSLKKTPYLDFYNEFNYQFNNQLFGVMTKLLQFLFITLRNQKDDRSRQGNKSNQNLRKHISQQIQFIKVPQVIKNFIHLLKNCSQDFQLNRYEIVNRLKLLLCSLDKNKLTRNDAIDILGQLLNQQTIYGKKKLLGDYSKNAICSYWIQIIKSNVLLHNVFYSNYLSIKTVAQSNLSQDNPDINNCFLNIYKLLEEVFKTMFDNTIYPSIQEKCIEFLNVVVEQLFPETGQHANDLATIMSSPTAKKVHENKLKILLKILQSASLKFQSIKNIFEEIDLYLTKKLGRKVTKDDLPEPSKLKHMQLNTLDISIAQTPNFNQKLVQYIENYDDKIDDSLLTVITIPNKFLTIYEEEDQLCFNSHPVKTTNFTLYMREVKTKLIQKTILLAHRLTKTFLTQNIQSYSQQQFQALKTIYFFVPNKKTLTQQQCQTLSTILKNGLKIFEILHNYDLHTDETTNKKGHLKNFMLIFAQIYDPVNFRDIFQPNMQQFFRNLVKYAKYCADYCLQYVLIEPFCANNNREQPFNKNIVQLLIYNLILRLQSTSDVLDPFHEFYGYKQQYFSLLQKLIRFPFRCLSRYSDDSFIRNYFRQIILILIKKAHTSRFCLDYLHLMRTLFKNILFNCNRDTASPLFSEFYAICSKSQYPSPPPQSSSTPHSIFVNVNVLQNFMKLYETGIPELADIVTQLIIMLPLKSKHIIHFAKQGYIVKPLLHCLCLMSDYNYTLRTLKTFEIIISHSNAQEINMFLEGVKDKLIDRLYFMVNQCKTGDLKLDKITNDLSPLSLKLLAKLGYLSRNKQLPIQMKPKSQQNSPSSSNKQSKLKQIQLVYKQIKTSRVFTISMMDAIEYAIEIFHKILDPFYQSIVFITMDMIEQCFELLKEVLPLTLVKMHQLSERIISIFCNILSLSSKYSTISQAILTHIRGQIRTIIKSQAQKITRELGNFGVNQYCQFFIRCLISNLSERVLITRQDNFIKQISEQPKRFLWQQLQSMLTSTAQTSFSDTLHEYIIRTLLSQITLLKIPAHLSIHTSQSEQYNQYNNILPYKNAALNCLNLVIDGASFAVLEQTKFQIIQAVFIVVTTIPEILNLKIMQNPSIIAQKIFNHMLKMGGVELVKYLQTQNGQRMFNSILENLVSYSSQCHRIAKMFLKKIMEQTDINLIQVLYGGIKWQQIYDKSLPYLKNQSKYSLDILTSSKQLKKCPIAQLAKNLVKISYNVNEQCLKSSPRMIKMLANAFLTYELLINIKVRERQGMSEEFKEKNYHAFSILGKNQGNNGGEYIEANANFDKNFENVLRVAQSIIQINANLYGNYTKIIIQQVPVPPSSTNPQQQSQPSSATGTSTTPMRPQPNTTTSSNNPLETKNPRDLQRVGGPTPTPQPPIVHTGPPQPTQTFSINPNTFIDDQEYGLNVEDFDMEIKSWSQLISSILKFQKSVLYNDTIFNLSKILQKNRIQKSPIIEKRIKIIFTMFDLIGRVQRSVRQTAYQSIKQLLSKQQHPKDLIQNDQKLKHILRPVLISLQLQFKKFTPSFLHMFRKILKLLTQCFNITLIQKLVDKLREMDKNKQPEGNNGVVGGLSNTRLVPHQPNTQNPRYANFSEISCQVKCIANFLGLFQHLAYAFHNHRSSNYAANTLILIFKYIVSISEFFVPKLGRHTVMVYIKSVLAKVLNTMCEKISGENIFNDGNERDLDFSNFLQIIKMDDSYPFRQKMTRDTAYIDKVFTEFSKSQNKKDYLTFLQIIAELATRNNRWLKNMSQFAQKLLKQLNHAIQNKLKRFQQRQISEIGQKNQIILLAKILLEYIKQNKDEIEYLFGLVNLFKLRVTFDLHFIKSYLKYQLYYNISPETRRKIFVQVFKMYRQPIKQHDTDKILAISQNVLYEFILIELSLPEESRSILIQNQQIIKSVVETIKLNLNPKLLHNRNANTFREAIEILQISNLMMRALKNLVTESDRSNMLCVVWGLLRIEDKIIRNYAFVWTSNYISYFDGLGQSKALGLYLILIRALEGLGHGDYQIGALIKKALNILIPYWDNKGKQGQIPALTNGANSTNNNTGTPGGSQQKDGTVANQGGNSWIEMSLRAVHDESSQPTKLVRFWQIVVKNHEIFNKFKESKFETQMVNSMQWLMVATNPTSTNPLVKKIASDMSFIYIQWKFKEVRDKIKSLDNLNDKIKVLSETFNERAAQICLNFFIKVALNNCNDKDDKQIMKRSLYLLKKTLILWPNTRKKFQNIKAIINKQKTTNTQGTQSPIRFHYTLLNIINILLLYETDQGLLPQLTTIFKLMELGQVSLPRFPGGGGVGNVGGTGGAASGAANQGHPGSAQQNVSNNSIFTLNNTYLMHLLCVIVKRLLKVAASKPAEQQSIKLINEIHSCIKQGFDFYVMATSSRARAGAQQANLRQPGPKKIQIEVAISFLKIMFDIDHKFADPHLNNIKQVASAHKKVFERGFESSNKNNSTNRVYEPPPLTEGTFQEMLNKDLQINVDLVKPEALLASQQNYQKQVIKSYVTKRPQLVILLRILAAKINLNHVEDQGNILDIFVTIYQKIPDPELKIQVINILKCLLIGKSAFPGEHVPERYQAIPLINYQQKKIFYMLLEDNKKFNLHFQKRKIKPSDPSYNISQMLYQQITAKVYFDFLCMYILNLRQITSDYLQKIRVFVLYALKIASNQLIQKIFKVLDERYYNRNRAGMFLALFQDYKELYCAEEYLQGDQIMLFFTVYLYNKVQSKCSLELHSYGFPMPDFDTIKFQNFYIKLTKSDQQSKYHLEMLIKLLKLSLALSEPSNPPLSLILKDYLLTGTYNDQQGQILLKIIEAQNCLSDTQLFAINTKIINWASINKHCQNSKKQNSKMIMDSLCKIYGDQDLIYGFRISVTRSIQLQNAMCQLQQRRYIQSLKQVQKYKILCSKRARAALRNTMPTMSMDEPDLADILQSDPLGQPIVEQNVPEMNITLYEQENNRIYMEDIIKECYKNLNKWDVLLEEKKSDVQTKIDYLFHCGSNKTKLSQNLTELENHNTACLQQFGYYYGKSIIHFLESNSGPLPLTSLQSNQSNANQMPSSSNPAPVPSSSSNTNKDLNVALFYSLIQWLCYPKNARIKQNQILVKVQCLLQLEQAQKIKDQSNNLTQDHKEGLDSLTKVVQNVYTNINYWRERMPNKNQSLLVWDAILGQRNMLYENIKKKNIALYENVISTASNISSASLSRSDKLFVPYTDVQWNKLKIQQQQRNFQIYPGQKPVQTQLYLDQNFLREKQKYYQLVFHQRDHEKALKLLQDPNNYKDEQLQKIQRAQRLRLKARLYKQRGDYAQANQTYFEAATISDQQLLTVWRDWMVMSIEAYNKTKDNSWAYSAISALPYTLRHKTYKTKLLLAPIFKILKDLSKDLTIKIIMESFVKNHLLPMKAMLHWLPQIINLAIDEPELTEKENGEKAGPMTDIIDKLSIYSFSPVFFTIKPFLFRQNQPLYKVAKNIIFKKMKNSGYHLTTKLQRFSQLISQIKKQDKISIMTLGQFYQTFTEISMPLIQAQIPQKVPYIIQISQNLQTEIMNNKEGKIITLMGSDGKQYRYRLEPIQKMESQRIFEALLSSQCLQTQTEHLKLSKQSSSRNLKLPELRKIYLKEDLAIIKNSEYSLSLLDILNNYLTTETAYSPQYPQNDKGFQKLPKNQINRTINKHMKEIVPSTILKSFIQKSAKNYDEYITFRKIFAYQYGTVMAMNYILSIEANLEKYVVDLRNGSINQFNFMINKDIAQGLARYGVRLSRNFMGFLGRVYVDSGVLPAMVATADAYCNEELNIVGYLECLYEDLLAIKDKDKQRVFNREKVNFEKRITDLKLNFKRTRKMLEIAEVYGECDDVPYQLKYWF